MVRGLVGLLAVGSSQWVHADVCRWRDAQGNVQYTASAGMPACERVVRTPPPVPVAAAQDYRQQELEFRQRRQARLDALERADVEKIRRDQQRSACDEARGRLAWMQSGGRMMRMDAGGQRNYLTQEELDQEIAHIRQRLPQVCL